MIDIRLSDNLDLMAEYGTGRKFKDYQDLKPKREIIACMKRSHSTHLM